VCRVLGVSVQCIQLRAAGAEHVVHLAAGVRREVRRDAGEGGRACGAGLWAAGVGRAVCRVLEASVQCIELRAVGDRCA
jgi:hypothetical protein